MANEKEFDIFSVGVSDLDTGDEKKVVAIYMHLKQNKDLMELIVLRLDSYQTHLIQENHSYASMFIG